MSIANKLIYLNGTKEKLKDSINNIGGSITDETTFRAYATELDNIYSNIPKTTGEGSNLSLTTLKGRINVDDILGDTEQDSTTGYNILNFNSYVALEDNMLSTNAGAGRVLASDIQLQANTTYYFKFILLKKPGTSTTLTSYIDGTPDTTIGQGNIQGYSVGTLVTKQITPTSNCVLSIAIWGNANAETIKFQYWVTTDNSKNTFEPYTNGASPNPTYPQPINVVTGTQEVVVQNKNLAYIEAEGKYRSSASGNFSINANYNGYIAKVSQNTTYSGSFTNMASNYNDVSNLCYFDKNMNFISGNSYNTANKTFTTPSNCAYVTMAVKTNIVDFQLEYGSTASSYVEHQEQTKTLHLGDIELAKIGTYQDKISKSSGKQLFDKDTTKEGYLIQVNGEEVANASYGASDYIPIKANTYYTRTNCNNYYGAFYNTNKEFVGAITNANTIISSVDGYVRISFLLTNTDKVMLNEGSTALPYEPYGSDKWYIEKNIGKVNLENIPWTGSTTASGYKLYATEQIRDIKYVSANTIVGEGLAYNYIMHTGNGMSHPSALNCIAIDTNAVRVQTTSQAPIGIFYYALATPTYTEITNTTLLNELNELEKMMSYNGQTNISVSGNLPMILNVSALKGE